MAVCENISGFDVYELLGNPDQGGIFVDNTGTPATFDPANATFTTDVPGLIVYNYIVGDPASSCGADTSIFSVITGIEIEAGEEVNETLCAGIEISLLSLLTNNSTVGIFSETTPSGGIVNTSDFNSDLVSDGEYIIYHILAGSGQCPDDTAVITLTIVDGPSAGDEQSEEVCGNEVIDLEILIDPSADPNGVFYNGGVEITNTTIDFSGITGDQEYLYIVGDGISCPFDTAEILITVPIAPFVSLVVDNSTICPGDCAIFILNADALGAQEITAFYSITGDDGFSENRMTTFMDVTVPLSVELCEGNGNQTNNFLMVDNIYTITFDSLHLNDSECVYFPNLNTTIEVLPNSDSLFQSMHCFGEEVTIGGNVYTEGNAFDSFSIPAANGCDSLITVSFDISVISCGRSYRN